MNLNGKIAIITGSSRGIGYSIASLFLLSGAKVVICGSKLESAEKACSKLAEEIDVDRKMMLPVGLDLGDKSQITSLVDTVISHWGKVDILVNNAGITSNHDFLDITDEDFHHLFEINFFGVVSLTREVVKYMKETGGSIIYTGSMVGIYGAQNQADYATSKFAIHGLTKSLAKELGKYHIRVNAVAPGVVKTDMVNEFVSSSMASQLKTITPLQDMAHPSDLAGAYLYLASDLSNFTTGTIIQVDGGLVL